MSLFSELKRRNVYRIGAAYVVVAWLAIQVVETILPAFGFGLWAVRAVTIALGIGLIPVLIFAWAFELTPEGLVREKDAGGSRPFEARTAKLLDRTIMGVLALAVGFFAFDRFVLEPGRVAAAQARQAAELEEARRQGRSEALVESYGDKSIAVLPFVNMSSDVEQDYFSSGISEELLNLLTRIPELRVISRSSAFSFRGQNLEIPEIARRLNVAHVLEGSVRRAGNRVRVTAQLIDARSDTHLWSGTYDRNLDDIFAIQDEIAAAVVEQLEVRLLGSGQRVQETDPEAYALFLQARHLGNQASAEGWEQAVALLQEVLAVDPGYAAAWNELARNYANQTGSGLRPFDEGYAMAREAAEKALSINPRFSPSHARLGWIAMLHGNDLAAAARHFQRALELDPARTENLSGAATLLGNLGRLEEAIVLDEYAVARDPVSPVGHANLGISYLCTGRLDQAIASHRTALRLSPDRYASHFYIGIALLFKGEAEAALQSMQREPYEVYRVLGQAMAYHALGQAGVSDEMLNKAIEHHARDAAYNIAYVLAWRREADRAFAWLDKAVEHNDPGLMEVAVQPLFSGLHNDPRWLPFLERIGKAPGQLGAIRFEAAAPDRGGRVASGG